MATSKIHDAMIFPMSFVVLKWSEASIEFFAENYKTCCNCKHDYCFGPARPWNLTPEAGRDGTPAFAGA